METDNKTKRQLLIEKGQKQKQKIKEHILNFFEGIVMYALTAAGVLMSKYMPTFKALIMDAGTNSVAIKIPISGEIIAAFAIALLVTYIMEKEGDKEGKRKNFKRRAITQLANGTLWYSLIGG